MKYCADGGKPSAKGPGRYTRGDGGKYMKHGGVVERQSRGPVGGYGKAMRGRGRGKKY